MINEQMDQPFLVFRCLFGVRMSSVRKNHIYDFRTPDDSLVFTNILKTNRPLETTDVEDSTIVLRGNYFYIFIHGKERNGSYYLTENTEVIVVTNGVSNPLEGDPKYKKFLNRKITCIELDFDKGDFTFDRGDMRMNQKLFFHILMSSIGYSILSKQHMSLLSHSYLQTLRGLLLTVYEEKTISCFSDLVLPLSNHFYDLWQKNNERRYDILFIICNTENEGVERSNERTKKLTRWFGYLFNNQVSVFVFFKVFSIVFVKLFLFFRKNGAFKPKTKMTFKSNRSLLLKSVLSSSRSPSSFKSILSSSRSPSSFKSILSSSRTKLLLKSIFLFKSNFQFKSKLSFKCIKRKFLLKNKFQFKTKKIFKSKTKTKHKFKNLWKWN